MSIFNKIRKQTKKSRKTLEEIYDQISDLSNKTRKLDKNDMDRILGEIKNNSSSDNFKEIKNGISSIITALNKIQIPTPSPADNSFFAEIKTFFQDIKNSLLRIEKNTVGSDNNITVASLTDAFKMELLKLKDALDNEKARANDYEEKYKKLLGSNQPDPNAISKSEFKKTIGEKDAEISRLKEKIEKAIGEKDTEISRLKEEFEKAIKEKDEEISRLKAIIDDLEGNSTNDSRVLKANENKVIVTAGSIESYISTVKDTSVIDSVFQKYGNENSYWKVYESYTKALKKFEPDEDEPDDTLYSFKDIFEKFLLKKLYTGITRSNNIKEGTLEYDLMMAVNSYIESCGFYTRDIAVGNKISDEDYDDTDQTGNGSIISEVSLYPYYLNYTDQSGDNIKIHTEGNIVIE